MGNKCRFCETFHGNVKRVAGVLQGSGCGCGNCSGQWLKKSDVKAAINYYLREIEVLDKNIEGIKQYKESLAEQIELLNDIQNQTVN